MGIEVADTAEVAEQEALDRLVARADLPLFDVRLRPHRSLSRGNVRLLLMIFGLIALASSVPFIIMGAWPVGGFMGLDIVLLTAAFRANIRAARAYEDVVVTPLELLLAKVGPQGRRQEYRFNPVWVRLDKEVHAEFGVQRLSLHSRGRSVEVAGFLGPDAKALFASDLSRALGEARRGPRYS
jgi:uncharacterized membrane protein